MSRIIGLVTCGKSLRLEAGTCELRQLPASSFKWTVSRHTSLRPVSITRVPVALHKTHRGCLSRRRTWCDQKGHNSEVPVSPKTQCPPLEWPECPVATMCHTSESPAGFAPVVGACRLLLFKNPFLIQWQDRRPDCRGVRSQSVEPA